MCENKMSFKNFLLLYPVRGETDGTIELEPQIIEGRSPFFKCLTSKTLLWFKLDLNINRMQDTFFYTSRIDLEFCIFHLSVFVVDI